jgi:hypothetical protein
MFRNIGDDLFQQREGSLAGFRDRAQLSGVWQRFWAAGRGLRRRGAWRASQGGAPCQRSRRIPGPPSQSSARQGAVATHRRHRQSLFTPRPDRPAESSSPATRIAWSDARNRGRRRDCRERLPPEHHGERHWWLSGQQRSSNHARGKLQRQFLAGQNGVRLAPQ